MGSLSAKGLLSSLRHPLEDLGHTPRGRHPAPVPPELTEASPCPAPSTGVGTPSETRFRVGRTGKDPVPILAPDLSELGRRAVSVASVSRRGPVSVSPGITRVEGHPCRPGPVSHTRPVLVADTVVHVQQEGSSLFPGRGPWMSLVRPPTPPLPRHPPSPSTPTSTRTTPGTLRRPPTSPRRENLHYYRPRSTTLLYGRG